MRLQVFQLHDVMKSQLVLFIFNTCHNNYYRPLYSIEQKNSTTKLNQPWLDIKNGIGEGSCYVLITTNIKLKFYVIIVNMWPS